MLLGDPNRLPQSEFLFSLHGSYPRVLHRNIGGTRRPSCTIRRLLGAPNKSLSAGWHGASKLTHGDQRHEP